MPCKVHASRIPSQISEVPSIYITTLTSTMRPDILSLSLLNISIFLHHESKIQSSKTFPNAEQSSEHCPALQRAWYSKCAHTEGKGIRKLNTQLEEVLPH